MKNCFRSRGFLPCNDPDEKLTLGEEFESLDRLGEEYPPVIRR